MPTGVYRHSSSHRKNLTLEQEYGIERAKEIRQKLKISHLGQRGRIPWSKGLKGEEFLRHFKNGIKGFQKGNTWSKGRKLSKEHIRKMLRRREKSSLEIKFENICRHLNLPYKFVGNGEFWIESKNPDFINTNGEKIAIEVYFRKHKELFKIGLNHWKFERQRIFHRYGWRIEFFDETQVNEEEIRRRFLL